MSGIKAEKIRLQYGNHIISDSLSISFSRPEIVSIIGPNGSGKSTLLKALGRIIAPRRGVVYLNGKDIQTVTSSKTAQTVAVLPQTLRAPEDMTVKDLVFCGRIPYRDRFSSAGEKDQKAVEDAMNTAGVYELRDRPMRALSGGERQRAWLAMALAQRPKFLLLDEPTTYLDIKYQMEFMNMVVHLYQALQITVIMVLHDLNHAMRFSSRLIGMKKGRIVLDGPPREVMTEENLEKLYGVPMIVRDFPCGKDIYTVCFPCGLSAEKGK